ncbi:uncharacterized protein PG998_010043 [Apiospora kogelbergensis]|uniref:uncharacterized protein n=1 Tax=Apiospora kogelbergensis TaxID=1337665 RepID=UPI00312EB2D1
MSGQRGGSYRMGVPSRDHFGEGPIPLAGQIVAAAAAANQHHNRPPHRSHNQRMLNRHRRFDPNSVYPLPLPQERPHVSRNQRRRGFDPNSAYPPPLPRERPHGRAPTHPSAQHTPAPQEGGSILRYPTPGGDFVPSSSPSATPSGDPSTDHDERPNPAAPPQDVPEYKPDEAALVRYQNWLVKELEKGDVKAGKGQTSAPVATDQATATTDQATASTDQGTAVPDKPSPSAKVTTPPGFPSRPKDSEQQKKPDLESEPELEHESEEEDDEPEPKEPEVRPTALASFYPLQISSGVNIWAIDPVIDRRLTDWPSHAELQDAGMDRATRGRERMIPIPRYRHLDARAVFDATSLEDTFGPGPIVAAAAAVAPSATAYVPRLFRQYAIDLVGQNRYPIPCDHEGA